MLPGFRISSPPILGAWIPKVLLYWAAGWILLLPWAAWMLQPTRVASATADGSHFFERWFPLGAWAVGSVGNLAAAPRWTAALFALGLWLIATLCAVLSYVAIGESLAKRSSGRSLEYWAGKPWQAAAWTPPLLLAAALLLTYVPMVVYGALTAMGPALNRLLGTAWAWPVVHGAAWALVTWGATPTLRRREPRIPTALPPLAGFILGLFLGVPLYEWVLLLLASLTGAALVITLIFAILGFTIHGPWIVLQGADGAVMRCVQLVLRDPPAFVLRWLIGLVLGVVAAGVVDVMGTQAEMWTRSALSAGSRFAGRDPLSDETLVEKSWPASASAGQPQAASDMDEKRELDIVSDGGEERQAESAPFPRSPVLALGPWLFLGLKLALLSALFCGLQMDILRATQLDADGTDLLDFFPRASEDDAR